MESRSGCPRGGAQRPHGALGRGRFAGRPAQGERPARGAGGGLTSPGKGSGQRDPPWRTLPRGGRSDGPRDGRGRQAFGAARSRRGRGANGGAGPGSAPTGVGQPRLCPCVSWLVRLSAPQGSGAVPSPGESAPRSPAAAGAWEARQRRGHPGLSRGPSRLVESHGYPRGSLVGAEQEARAAAAVSSSAASSKSHPRALLSLSGCLEGSRPARAGDGGGGAAAGGRRGVLFGDGESAERERP